MTQTTTNSTNSTNSELSADAVHVLARDEGEHLHFLGNLATIKATAEESGALSAVEFVAPQGFGPPVHCHRDEDELVVVLDGEVAFRSGDEEIIGGEGAVAYLPHAVPHTFQVLSDTARMLSVTASKLASPVFDRMVASIGKPAPSPELPGFADIDPTRLAEVNAAHGIDILGPPPAPLAGS